MSQKEVGQPNCWRKKESENMLNCATPACLTSVALLTVWISFFFTWNGFYLGWVTSQYDCCFQEKLESTAVDFVLLNSLDLKLSVFFLP